MLFELELILIKLVNDISLDLFFLNASDSVFKLFNSMSESFVKSI